MFEKILEMIKKIESTKFFCVLNKNNEEKKVSPEEIEQHLVDGWSLLRFEDENGNIFDPKDDSLI